MLAVAATLAFGMTGSIIGIVLACVHHEAKTRHLSVMAIAREALTF